MIFYSELADERSAKGKGKNMRRREEQRGGRYRQAQERNGEEEEEGRETAKREIG